MEKITKHEPQD